MSLSSQQLQTLREMVSQGKPNYIVSQWLSVECGLNFSDATEERLKAVEWHKTNEKEQSISNQTSEENRTLSPEAQEDRQGTLTPEQIEDNQREESSIGESATENSGDEETINKTEEPELHSENFYETKAKCVSCGDDVYTCSCEVKTVEQIPF